MIDLSKSLEQLVKTLEAGNYNSAPSTLVQGSALQIEDLSPVMQNVTYGQEHIKLQKLFSVKSEKSMLAQWNRQLSYGRFGGTAQREGAVGDVDTGDYVRAVTPMCFYSEVRRVTLAANLVATFDGQKNEARELENSAMKIAGDIEFDMFRGKADFSNAGVFDANPLAIPELPNLLGVDPQIRQSDLLATTQDLMFAAFGSNQSVVLFQNGALNQPVIEDASLRVRLNLGNPEAMYVSMTALSAFNKAVALQSGTSSIQRIMLAGSPQDAAGADLRRQWVSHASIPLEPSRFLEGKTSPLRPRIGAPAAPGITSQPSASGSGTNMPALTNAVYLITASNERGEGPGTLSNTVNVTAGQQVALTITAQAGVTHFSVYRGTSAANAKFVGHVAATGGNVVFTDLGNMAPGSSTAYLLEKQCWEVGELMPFSKVSLAVTDLSTPTAGARFLALKGLQPRKNAVVTSIF